MAETSTKSIDFALFSEAGINASEERIRELSQLIDFFKGCKTQAEKVERLRALKYTILF